MANEFNHSTPGLTAGTARTLLYGPVGQGTRVIVFSGTFSNVDDDNRGTHWITLESLDGSGNYTNRLNQIPIQFGAASMCPKIVLLPGESLYVTADAAGVVSCSVEVLVIS